MSFLNFKNQPPSAYVPCLLLVTKPFSLQFVISLAAWKSCFLSLGLMELWGCELKIKREQNCQTMIYRKIPSEVLSMSIFVVDSGRELYGFGIKLALRWFNKLLDRWEDFLRIIPWESLGHVSLSELSLSEAASFIKHICRLCPRNRSVKHLIKLISKANLSSSSIVNFQACVLAAL